MKPVVLSFGLVVMVSGCIPALQQPPPENPAEPEAAIALETPGAASTAEALDTTTAAERAAALAPVPAGERELGRTVASLGDPVSPGFWLATPLVSEPGQGRVFYRATGQSVVVELRPIAGPATGGSQISLPAMRLLGAPLTGLPELVVYAG